MRSPRFSLFLPSDLRAGADLLAEWRGFRFGSKSFERDERLFTGIVFGIPFGDSACPSSQKYQPRADAPKKIGSRRPVLEASAPREGLRQRAQLGECHL